MNLFFILTWTLIGIRGGIGKIHHLSIVQDTRQSIEVSDFAFLRSAYFNVEISNFTSNIAASRQIGFTFSKGNVMEDILKSKPTLCPLLITQQDSDEGLDDIVYFFFNFDNKSLDITRRGASVEKIDICSPLDLYGDVCTSDLANSATAARAKSAQKSSSVAKIDTIDQNSTSKISKNKKTDKEPNITSSLDTTSGKLMKRRTKREVEPKEAKDEADVTDVDDTFSGDGKIKTVLVNYLPLTYENKEYYTKFSIRFWRPQEEGEYYFYFHNCHNYRRDYKEFEAVTFSISVVEKNSHSYLPAGEIGKPRLYFGLAALFLATTFFWVCQLRSNKDNVYKIHYLMTTLLFIKSLSLLFHGVNFYFISTLGRQQEAWAVVYYIMHLLKGALLFGTIILIGTGWTFFKNFLTDRDRRLFMVIIPLQVIDNIALIIILESEEGERSYRFWWQLFILVDLLCCAAIILPVIWSIRHLQEASETDGKAAFNLQKLKLFRHFYIIIIIYIYTTRILRYLISFVVPFQFEWLLVVVEEVGTWFFFVVSGYKFRPTMNNPYLRLAQSDDDMEMDTALTQSGALEGVVRVNRPNAPSSSRSRKGKQNDDGDEAETGLLAEHSLEHD